eukprot:gene21290-28216_t
MVTIKLKAEIREELHKDLEVATHEAMNKFQDDILKNIETQMKSTLGDEVCAQAVTDIKGMIPSADS